MLEGLGVSKLSYSGYLVGVVTKLQYAHYITVQLPDKNRVKTLPKPALHSLAC